MKCANCDKDAFYIYQLTEKKQIVYCNKHLPRFLEQAKKAGLLKTTDTLKSVIENGLKTIANLTVEPVLVEEVTVEEPQEPKKKAAKKKAD